MTVSQCRLCCCRRGISAWCGVPEPSSSALLASWRRFITRGDAGGLLSILILIAVLAVAVVPVATSWENYGGSIAPIGPSLIIGSFTFGIGMQLANGCGSGTLYTVGGGSGRMLITLALFIAGSVLGSISLPTFLNMGGIDPVLAGNYLGPWGGLGGNALSIALVGWLILQIARRRGGSTEINIPFSIGAFVIAAVMIAVFFAGGHPWSVHLRLHRMGRKARDIAGL